MTTMSTALQVIDPPALPMPVIDSPALEVLDRTVTRVARQMPQIVMSFENYIRMVDYGVEMKMDLYETNQKLLTAEEQITQEIEQSNEAQDQLNQTIDDGAKKSNGFLNAIKNVSSTFKSAAGSAKKVVNFLKPGVETAIRMSDEYENMRVRLERINDGNQTTEELQDKIFAAANRARGDYNAMASVITQMGTSGTFTKNEELIAFTELMQKSFRASGATTAEQQSGMTQINQAVTKGSLGSGEFDLIMKDAPMMAKALSDYTGQSMEQLRKMANEGELTSEVLKAAVLASASDINEDFGEMPRTFSDVMGQINNVVLQSFVPAIAQISEILNDSRIQQSLEGFGEALTAISFVAVRVMEVIVAIANVIFSNWNMIEPIFWGVAAAVIAWNIAQKALNISLTSNPIGILIMAMIALVTAIMHLWNTNDQFAAGLMRAWNAILNFFDQVPIFFVKIGNGIANAFDNARVTSLKIMEGLVNGVINGINMLIEMLNQIPGVSLDAISHVEFSAAEEAAAQARKQAREDQIASMEADAASKAQEREQKVVDMLESRAAKRAAEQAEQAEQSEQSTTKEKDIFGYSSWQDEPGDINKVNEVGKIRDTVDVSSEDLKLMRELAELKNIQNFVTLTPQVSVQTGDIRETADTQTIISQITNQLTVELESSARGVYA